LANIKYIYIYIYVYVYNCFYKFIKAVLSEASSSAALKAAFKATLSEVSMKAASMIVLYNFASPDVVGHIILDHVSLISHYMNCLSTFCHTKKNHVNSYHSEKAVVYDEARR